MSENTGTAATEPTEPVTDPDAEVIPDPEGAEALGDAGKKALDAMKERAKTAEKGRREAQAEIDKLKADLEAASKRGDDVEAIQKAVDEQVKAITDGMNRRLVEAEVRAAAVGKLNDPADALRYTDVFDVSTITVNADGSVDTSAITAGVDALLQAKPYLAAQGQGVKGSGDGGTRNGSQPSQLTRTDLARMSPAEIDKARQEGRLDKVLSGT